MDLFPLTTGALVFLISFSMTAYSIETSIVQFDHLFVPFVGLSNYQVHHHSQPRLCDFRLQSQNVVEATSE